MFVEFHLLQNFAPANLNRDDTGAPKDCEFGGYRRARISSQCLKRAIRTAFVEQELLPAENRALRTKRLSDELVKMLATQGKDEADARAVASAALKGMGLALDQEGKTEYLIFLGQAEITALATACLRHWEVLGSATASSDGAGTKGSAKDAKKAGKDAIPAEVRKELERIMDGGKAVDLALFGRMLADRPDRNVDAASQVAHAISTNKVSMEFDFYTAVDDLKPGDTSGADMLGTVEFNSACFYRYANLDLNQLRENLGDTELTEKAVEAFLRASVLAVPSGKQNSMAAQNPPSFVLVVARRAGLWSLANAFVRPIFPDRQGDLVEKSVQALDAYWGQLVAHYGEQGILGKWCIALNGNGLKNLAGARVTSLVDLARHLSACVADGSLAKAR